MKKGIFLVLIFLSHISNAQDFDQKEIEFWDLSHTFKLSGTLTTPKALKNYPAVVLISGSGQTDRDETIGNHKIFKTLAEYLSNNGIAVLRYDDRGGFNSGGPSTAISTTQDLALDVEAAVKYLKKEEKIKKVGLIGHSEGGGIGPMVIANVKKIAFFVSMAGPGVSRKEVLIKQNKDIYLSMKVPEAHIDHYLQTFFEPVIDLVTSTKDSLTKAEGMKALGMEFREKYKDDNIVLKMNTSEKNIPVFMKQLNSNWFRSFLAYDPRPYWSKIYCPTLALNGDLDLQVEAKVNLGAIESVKNKNITTKILKSHNHLFQKAKTGSLQEYAKLPESISEEALLEIKTFILSSK